MLTVLTIAMAFAGTERDAPTAHADYPSCAPVLSGVAEQAMAGSERRAQEMSIAMRTNILQADIGNARKADRLTEEQAATLWRQVQQVRASREQTSGLSTAAQQADHHRALAQAASMLCAAVASIANDSGGEPQNRGSGRLIVFYESGDAGARQRIIDQAQAAGLSIFYDLKHMNAIVIGGVAPSEVRQRIGTLEAVPGVLSVRSDEVARVLGGARID